MPPSAPPPLYILDKRLPKAAAKRLEAQLKVFNKNMAPVLQEIKEANTAAGVHVKRTLSRGRSMAAKNAVRRGTTLFVYFGSVVDAKNFDGPLTYTYGADITGSEAGEFFIDGKGREKGLMRKDWRFINGIYINHCCRKHNLKADFVQEEESGICYVAFSTSRDVKAGEELFSNYNEGDSKKNKYWRRLATLKANGVPQERIVKCKCFTSKNGKMCPNSFAYDKAEMRAYGLDAMSANGLAA
jgi:hypothetical protein